MRKVLVLVVLMFLLTGCSPGSKQNTLLPELASLRTRWGKTIHRKDPGKRNWFLRLKARRKKLKPNFTRVSGVIQPMYRRVS